VTVNAGATGERYISKRKQGGYIIRLPRRLTGGEQKVFGTCDTLEDAVLARDAELRRLEEIANRPEIEGLTNQYEQRSDEELWVEFFGVQKSADKRARIRADQRIIIPQPDKPFGIAYLSDFHIGSGDTDYYTLRRDVETIAATPRLYCEYHGDGWDNWITAKLMHLQRDQPLPLDHEVQLFAAVMEKLGGSLLWAVAGNHDNWSRKLAGVDRVRDALQGTRVLYDPHEVVFSLVHGDTSWRIKCRHKWKYRSIFNVTHGIEVGWQRGDTPFDIGLGGHTHQGTFARTFVRHETMCWAVLTGTYKRDGSYGRQIGAPRPFGTGCGVHVFRPGHLPVLHYDVASAAEYLGYLLEEK
jgi:hypothetical protein